MGSGTIFFFRPRDKWPVLRPGKPKVKYDGHTVVFVNHDGARRQVLHNDLVLVQVLRTVHYSRKDEVLGFLVGFLPAFDKVPQCHHPFFVLHEDITIPRSGLYGAVVVCHVRVSVL